VLILDFFTRNNAPHERYKQIGAEYFQGGYFKFDELTEQRSA